MRNSLILLLLSAFCAGAFAGTVDGKIKELAAFPGVKNASWGLSVRDADTGKSVAEHDPGRNLVPASTMKLLVTAAALDKFGPEGKFRTRLYYDGEIANGFLNGNLYIKGGGDPSLGSQLVKGAAPLDDVFKAWTEAVKAAGIRVVNGAVVGDESSFESVQPGSWAWEDIGNYYAAQPSALTVNDGLYKLYFKPAAAGGAAEVLRTEPYIEGLKFENHMKTGPAGSGDNGYIYAFPGQFQAVLRGSIPAGQPEFAIKGALPDPALFAAQGFWGYLARAGVNCNKKPYRGTPPEGAKLTLLAETAGAPLKEIVHVTNKRSFNLYAELLLRQLGGGSPEAGLVSVKSFLAASGADVSELDLEDACGLSPRDTVKAETFVSLLRSLKKKSWFQDFYDSLVFPGDQDATGHVRNLGKGTALEKNLRMKSGSLNGVRSYAGYLKTKKGRTLVFGSVMNGYSCGGGAVDKLQEELLLSLYNAY